MSYQLLNNCAEFWKVWTLWLQKVANIISPCRPQLHFYLHLQKWWSINHTCVHSWQFLTLTHVLHSWIISTLWLASHRHTFNPRMKADIVYVYFAVCLCQPPSDYLLIPDSCTSNDSSAQTNWSLGVSAVQNKERYNYFCGEHSIQACLADLKIGFVQRH